MPRNAPHNIDGKVVTVVGLALAAFVAVTGVAMLDVGFGHTQWNAISNAQASGHVAEAPKTVLAAAPARTVADEHWAADESSKGTRPDASH